MNPVTLHTIKQALEPFVVYFGALFTSGYLTALLTEATKFKAVFIPGEKFPRLTAAAISLVTTVVAMYLTPADLVFHTPWAYVPFAVGVIIVSASVYERILRGLKTNQPTTPTPTGTVTLPPNL